MDRPRVLVVDDDADVGEFLRDALSSFSYDVTRVASGREAVDLISHQIFDAALSTSGCPRWTVFKFSTR